MLQKETDPAMDKRNVVVLEHAMKAYEGSGGVVSGPGSFAPGTY